jgi:[acyl-carrier-protein] S-malonyltransferase
MLTAGIAVFACGWKWAASRRVWSPATAWANSALVAAGVLRLKRCRTAGRTSRRGHAGGRAVGRGRDGRHLGLDAGRCKVAACAEAAQGQVVEAVNFNEPKQIVIAGHAAAVQRAAELVKAKGRQARPHAAGIGAVSLP